MTKRFLAVLALALAVLTAAPAPAWAEGASEAARRHYERGLESARQGDLRTAKAEFERAFQESPHFAVRFNLGKVCFELGELPEAREHFTFYLREGGSKISETRKQEVERALRVIDERIAEQASAVPEPAAAASARPSEKAPTPAAAPVVVAAAPPPSSKPQPPLEHRYDAKELDRARRRTLAYALGASGGVMLVAGVVVLVWNEGQLTNAEEERSALLGSPPPAEIRTDEELARVITYEHELAQNQASISSAADYRAVGWALAGVGTALVVSGVVLFVTSETSGSVRVHAGPGNVALSGVW